MMNSVANDALQGEEYPLFRGIERLSNAWYHCV